MRPPLMIGIFGDWIFGAQHGSHWHLDLLEGNFRQVARDSTEFNARSARKNTAMNGSERTVANIALENGFTPNRDECLAGRLRRSLAVRFPSTTFRCSR